LEKGKLKHHNLNLYRTYFGGTIPYIEDPFDRKRAIEKVEREAHHSKLQDKPFKN
jgi:hypothetical protein